MTRKYLASTILATTLSFGVAHAASTTLNTGGSSLAAPTYIALFQTYTTANPSILFNYEAVGSGAGQKAFLNNDITQFENVPTGTLTYGTIVGTQVDVGASDAFLAASQLTNAATGSYGTQTEGSVVDGPLIQIPTIGVPVTMAYNESKQTSTLTLTDSQICGVLSGKINDWHTLNSAIPAGTTILVAYRSDSSGTTFLTTQHLHAVCNSTNSSFPTLPVPVTKVFVGTGGVFTTAPAHFTGESGSANVASYLVANSGGFGYLSPDYTSIAPKSKNTTSLKVANVVNGINGLTYAPTVANTETGLVNPGPGSTDGTPPSTKAAAMNPLNWVPSIPQTNSGYSIVGYTTVELSTCYADKTAGSALIGLLVDAFNNSTYKTIITNNGFAPLANTGAAKFGNAIAADFLTNTSGYNLDIDDTTVCASLHGR